MSYLTDSCGVVGHTVATDKAVLYEISGGVADAIEVVMVAAAIGSGISLIGAMKNAYDDFQIETASFS